MKEESWPDIYNGEKGEPKLQMARGTANVPEHLIETCVEAAEECPGSCIFVDVLDD